MLEIIHNLETLATTHKTAEVIWSNQDMDNILDAIEEKEEEEGLKTKARSTIINCMKSLKAMMDC